MIPCSKQDKELIKDKALLQRINRMEKKIKRKWKRKGKSKRKKKRKGKKKDRKRRKRKQSKKKKRHNQHWKTISYLNVSDDSHEKYHYVNAPCSSFKAQFCNCKAQLRVTLLPTLSWWVLWKDIINKTFKCRLIFNWTSQKVLLVPFVIHL